MWSDAPARIAAGELTASTKSRARQFNSPLRVCTACGNGGSCSRRDGIFPFSAAGMFDARPILAAKMGIDPLSRPQSRIDPACVGPIVRLDHEQILPCRCIDANGPIHLAFEQKRIRSEIDRERDRQRGNDLPEMPHDRISLFVHSGIVPRTGRAKEPKRPSRLRRSASKLRSERLSENCYWRKPRFFTYLAHFPHFSKGVPAC